MFSPFKCRLTAAVVVVCSDAASPLTRTVEIDAQSASDQVSGLDLRQVCLRGSRADEKFLFDCSNAEISYRACLIVSALMASKEASLPAFRQERKKIPVSSTVGLLVVWPCQS